MSLNRTSFSRTSDKELVISRTFRAPAHIVFDAWTKPEYVRRWWAPVSRGVTVTRCDADLRPGGAHRYELSREGAVICAFYGEYIEIVRPTRLVYTQIFEPFPDAPVLVTVSFEERDGATTVTAREAYPTKQALEAATASGMEEGARETYDLLDELVVSLRG